MVMAHATINGRPIRPPSSRHVVSRSAILILSGILIGVTIGHGDLSGLASFRFYAGIVGLISYMGLELVARSSQKNQLRRTLAATDSTLRSRLTRHVTSDEPKGSGRPNSNNLADSSYLPVTVSDRS